MWTIRRSWRRARIRIALAICWLDRLVVVRDDIGRWYEVQIAQREAELRRKLRVLR